MDSPLLFDTISIQQIPIEEKKLSCLPFLAIRFLV